MNLKHCATHGYYVVDTCPRCGSTTTQAKQVATLPAKKRTRKSKRLFDGFTFDSNPEFQRYMLCLRPLYQTGVIKHLCVHPTTELLKGVYPVHHTHLQHKKPRKISRLTYTADFAYVYRGVLIVEDVKASYRKTSKSHDKGDPILTPAARLRHRILQMQRPYILFDIVCDFEVSVFRWDSKELEQAA